MESLSTFRKPPSNRTLGIEWEVFFEESVCPTRYHHMGFFYVTTDGSLSWPRRRGEPYYQGRELVSQPLTAAWLLKELDRVSKKLPQVFVNDSCGIHIHVSRKWATAKKVDHLIHFLTTLSNDEHLEAFGREPNDYCRHMRNLHTTTKCRYFALNTTRKDTVEFRVFRSGNVKWAQYCVKLVNYMMENANHLNKEAFFAFVDMTQPK